MLTSKLKPNGQIYQEACEWLITFRTDWSDNASRDGLDAWLRRSPEHVRAYLEVSAVWEDIGLHDSGCRVSAEDHIARALAEGNVISLPASEPQVASLASEASAEDSQVKRRPSPVNISRLRNPKMRALYALAASALLTFGLAAKLYLDRNVYSTAIGEQRSLTLADGSVIELNAHSRLRIDFSNRQRDVELLQGQALFQVAHDPRRPFIVRSGRTAVRAVGTQFDVYRKNSNTTVTVVEGRVAVSPASDGKGSVQTETRSAMGNREVIVDSGEQVVARPQLLTRPMRVNVAAATAWTERRLVFDNAPLSDVVEEFNRYNAHRLLIDAPALEGFRVIGVFSSTDPGSLLRFLSAQPGIAVLEDGNQTRITSK